MRTRLRLGAAAAIGLGALLLATVLASPALAWHSSVTVNARCLDGQVRVHYTVEAWEKGHPATVDVFYQVNGGEPVELESDRPLFNKLTGHFDLANDTAGEITVTAVTTWNDDKVEESTNTGGDKLPPPGKCEEHESSTSGTEPTTSTAPQEPTTTVAVGAATSTTTGGQLPFTGAGSSQPMLLAGIALVGGGGLFLLLSRERRTTR
jgi:LPXTG-motif cell wall-anchored protein